MPLIYSNLPFTKAWWNWSFRMGFRQWKIPKGSIHWRRWTVSPTPTRKSHLLKCCTFSAASLLAFVCKMGKWIVIYVLSEAMFPILYIYIYCIIIYKYWKRRTTSISVVDMNVSPNIGYKWIWRDIKPTHTGNLARNKRINMWYS